jgi:tetratricopeptide (TPR) repeat protein
MEPDRACPQCGQPIPAGSAECPRCKLPSPLGSETVLGLSLIALGALFILTGFAARSYHATYQSLGREWYARGESDLNAGRAQAAIVDFHTALLYARDSDLYQLSLARALGAAGRTDEARAYLTSLWDRDPANAVVNLELGRLAARVGNTDEALRYYHNAMYDDWGSRDPAEARRTVRLELYQFLMKQGDRSQAQAELVAMAALLPPDPKLYTQAGHLFVDVGDYTRAANEFEGALRLGGGEEAVAGAGEAEFSQGNYRQARLYLERAVRAKPGDIKLSGMLQLANLVLTSDPFDPHLKLEERNRRVIRAFNQALSRLAACGLPVADIAEPSPLPPADLKLAPVYEHAQKLRPQVQPEVLRKNPDLVTEIMDLVFQIEQTAEHECRSPEPLDRALVLLASQRRNS